MKFKIRYIDPEIISLYFSFTSEELMYFSTNNAEATKSILELIIENEIEKKLNELDVPHTLQKFYRFFSPYKYGKPVIGVVTFLKVPEVLSFKFPMSIPQKYSNITITKKDIHKEFLRYCDYSEFYDTIEGNKVDEKSIIIYDYVYKNIEDNRTFFEAREQEFDFLERSDEFIVPLSSLLKKKKGDKVIEQKDNTLIELTIKQIINRVTTTNEKIDELLEQYGLTRIEDYEMIFSDVLYTNKKVDNYIDFIIDYIVCNNQITYENKGIELYIDNPHPFSEDVDNLTDDMKIINAKRCIAYDLLEKMIMDVITKGDFNDWQIDYDTPYFRAVEYLADASNTPPQKVINKFLLVLLMKKHFDIKGIEINERVI